MSNYEIKINKSLFKDVTIGDLEIEFKISNDSDYVIYNDGEFGSHENNIHNLATKEQVDEIIRVRNIMVNL